MQRIYVVGTADTKGEELAFLGEEIRRAGAAPILVDVGTRVPTITVDISASDVATHAPPPVSRDDRGAAVSAMTKAFAAFIASRTDIAGIVGIGGSGGTSIVTAGMRQLPIGVPKLMVSTLASGDVGPYVGVSDIVMMPSITDLAGLNRVTRTVLANAAAAIVAMSARAPLAATEKPALGLTMFGVTTPAVTRMAEQLADDYEPLVFHATGTGGQTMEALASSGLLAGLLDITTTEIADLLFGGALPALPTRLDVVATRRLPYVGSLGACDMVNFWAPQTVPSKYAGRAFYTHNANVTLMRTTAEECRAIGTWIGRKLDACDGPVRFLIPELGVSALDIEGGAFWDPAADAAMFAAIADNARWGGNRQLLRLPLHINDPAFADAAVAAFREIVA